ncbi:cation:H+ antiporter [Christiangramia gaetbulicola]|uniref:Cation:H+ antiporter n=1 Tax=Christiangramia gaetbulicola TaxID=703340 RepID=A0A2T6ACT9_9FLAO|nr:calcium/sodium antiporter [Christiangramia gaetbulicola]PTX41630.1 cation:H+ antiporter [Christiangramia gaetbulicola]
MLIQVLLLIGGFVLLIKGADWLINGASSLARAKNVPDLIIGLTIVAFGTSAPELIVNTVASFEEREELVFGNVIGSNNFNLFLILGVTGLISPLVVQRNTVRKEIPISLVATLILFFLANNFISSESVLTRFDGVILFTLFLAFLVYIKKQLSNKPEESTAEPQEISNLKIAGLVSLGLIGLILGGKLVVDSASNIAGYFGVSEKIIGLTIVAAGTSLPELATSVMAGIKKNADIAVGNIIGSNIFNILLILGSSALVRPLMYDPVFNTDIYLLLGGTIFIMIFMYTGQKMKLDRWEAFVLLTCYLIYTAWLISKEM